MTAFEEKLIQQLETLPQRIADAIGKMAREITIEERTLEDAWHDKYEAGKVMEEDE
jgi:hypothetical protein